MALGWPTERIIVIDQDWGHSGASAADRAGVQRLVAEVGLGQVGLVLGLEVSRLARSSSAWHRVLEIGALTGTLMLAEDGLYDPATFENPATYKETSKAQYTAGKKLLNVRYTLLSVPVVVLEVIKKTRSG